MPWHVLESETTLSALRVVATERVSEAEASQRFEHYGANEMIERGTKSLWRMLWEQTTASHGDRSSEA